MIKEATTKGNDTIAKILSNDYSIKNLSAWEDICYEIMDYGDAVQKIKITSKTGASFCSPVYAMFDGKFMNWYGDYGSWGFNCTWDTNVMNLPYDSPYYQLEKLESPERSMFDSDTCKQNILEIIHSDETYNSFSDEDKKIVDDYITGNDCFFIDTDSPLYEYEELLDDWRDLYESAEDEIDYFSKIRSLDFYECFDTDDYDEFDLYSSGFYSKAPVRFFIILYILSVVCNSEKGKDTNNNESN